MRILVIEDSPTYAKLAGLLLKAIGHEVLRAGTATEGLEVARHERPDLVLMDIHLPDMNGFEAVRILRSDPAAGRIPAIALTADRVSNEAEHEMARAAGFDAYAEKPFNEAAFRALLEQWEPGAP